MDIFVDFVAIFVKDGTNTDYMQQYFMDHGAKATDFSYDYITVNDEPGKAVAFFVQGMPWANLVRVKLDLGLKDGKQIGLPDYHYVCVQ